MAYGLSNGHGHVTDDVTWPPEGAVRRYGRLPSDSLASCDNFYTTLRSEMNCSYHSTKTSPQTAVSVKPVASNVSRSAVLIARDRSLFDVSSLPLDRTCYTYGWHSAPKDSFVWWARTWHSIPRWPWQLNPTLWLLIASLLFHWLQTRDFEWLWILILC